MRSSLKRALGLGALTAVVYALWRAAEQRRSESPIRWSPQPFPAPPVPSPRTGPAGDGSGDGSAESEHGTASPA